MARAHAAALFLGISTVACTARRESPEPVPAQLASRILDRVPPTATRAHAQFGGKVALVGFEADPALAARPGETIRVRLYWRSLGPLADGWRLFTHLVNDRGLIIGNYDLAGPLRTGSDDLAPPLRPSRWQPGKVYVDELAIEIPAPGSRPVTDRITLVAGVWRGSMRLDVRGAPARDQAAVVTHFRTGVEPAAIAGKAR